MYLNWMEPANRVHVDNSNRPCAVLSGSEKGNSEES